jgi:phosphatidylinositol alpha-1,6-mannosyltransferase
MGPGRAMSHPRPCLALVTDAYGGRGGIAQFNRDLAAALISAPSIGAVEILPRMTPAAAEEPPVGVRQHAPRLARAGYAQAAWRLAGELEPGLIFCGHLFMAPLAAALARRARARLIVQAHGIEAWSAPTLWRRRAVERADLVWAVSRDTRARLLRWADIEPERVRVASNTVAEDFTPADSAGARERLALPDRFTILTVGRLDSRERYKGHDRIIPLLKCLRRGGAAPLYLIAGEGDDRPRLEALVRAHGVDNEVRFLGHVPRQTLPDLYRAAELFVMPSSGEGFGIVLLEAMACGTPAVGLAVGGASDALCDGELGAVLEESDLLAGLQLACGERLAGRLPAGEELSARVHARFGRAAFNRRIHAGVAALGLN